MWVGDSDWSSGCRPAVSSYEPASKRSELHGDDDVVTRSHGKA